MSSTHCLPEQAKEMDPMDIIGWFPNELESKVDAVCVDFVEAAAATAVCPDATAARYWNITCRCTAGVYGNWSTRNSELHDLR
jgi:hypothetical protein